MALEAYLLRVWAEASDGARGEGIEMAVSSRSTCRIRLRQILLPLSTFAPYPWISAWPHLDQRARLRAEDDPRAAAGGASPHHPPQGSVEDGDGAGRGGRRRTRLAASRAGSAGLLGRRRHARGSRARVGGGGATERRRRRAREGAAGCARWGARRRRRGEGAGRGGAWGGMWIGLKWRRQDLGRGEVLKRGGVQRGYEYDLDLRLFRRR